MSRQLQLPLTLVFLTISIIGCILPWIITPPGSLQMGAYDLAEWTSLVPSVRQSAPFLWLPLALRLPIAVIGLAFSISTGQKYRIWAAAIVLLTSIALLPPLEFLTIYRDDVNYQQQFIIAVCTLIIGIADVLWRNESKSVAPLILLCIAGCIACGIGIGQAYSLMNDFGLAVKLGIGVGMTILGLGGVALLATIKQSRT